MVLVNSSAFGASKQSVSTSLQQITSAPVYKLVVIEKAVQLQRNYHSIIYLDDIVKNKNFLNNNPHLKDVSAEFR
ncbi:DNA polymerase II large subunit [Trichinella pseudospiralis]